MPDRSRIFVVTGDEVVRFMLTGFRADDVETVLTVPAPRSVAVDPHDPNRVYVGTFDDGLFATDDGGETWRESWDGWRPARDVGCRLPIAPGGRSIGRLRRDRAQQPVPLRGRGEDLAAAARAAAAAERATLVFPPASMDPPRAHDRAAPDRPGRSDRGDRARRRDALVGRRADLGRPQPAGAQRRPPADHAPARHRAVYEVAGQGIAVSPDRGQSWRRLDDGLDRHYAWATAADPADPGPVVRVGESRSVRRPQSRRRPGAAAALTRERLGADRQLGRGAGAAADAIRAGGAARAARAAAGRACAAGRCWSRATPARHGHGSSWACGT